MDGKGINIWTMNIIDRYVVLVNRSIGHFYHIEWNNQSICVVRCSDCMDSLATYSLRGLFQVARHTPIKYHNKFHG